MSGGAGRATAKRGRNRSSGDRREPPQAAAGPPRAAEIKGGKGGARSSVVLVALLHAVFEIRMRLADAGGELRQAVRTEDQHDDERE